MPGGRVNALSVAARGKGSLQALHRAAAIGAHYGLGPSRMERRVETVLGLVERFSGRATLPVTAATVARNPRALPRFEELGIEFAVHGMYHVDHVSIPGAEQRRHFERALRTLATAGLAPVGFRAPYLRWTDDTLTALRENGFEYDSSQAVHLPLLDEDPGGRYARALEFYGAVSALDEPVLPRIEHGLVRIPYCLPDDEAVVDRLRLDPYEISRVWAEMFRMIHARGEVFTLAVHPERIDQCADGIAAVLREAAAARPAVWLARLDEVARWWRARTGARVEIVDAEPGTVQVAVHGPAGVTLQVKGTPTEDATPWDGRWNQARGPVVAVRSDRRPVLGIDPRSDPRVAPFLRQQGYLVESVEPGLRYAKVLRIDRFPRADELPLLADLETDDTPLVRLGRWPDGAKSVVSLTGDLDALTVWDYAFRALGR